MRDMQCIIPKLADMQASPRQWSFKAFWGKSQAFKWVENHPQMECRCRGVQYTPQDYRVIVNYRKLPIE